VRRRARCVRPRVFAPRALGLTLTAMHLMAIPIASASLNPARSPAIHVRRHHGPTLAVLVVPILAGCSAGHWRAGCKLVARRVAGCPKCKTSSKPSKRSGHRAQQVMDKAANEDLRRSRCRRSRCAARVIGLRRCPVRVALGAKPRPQRPIDSLRLFQGGEVAAIRDDLEPRAGDAVGNFQRQARRREGIFAWWGT
jgi:hypothetical protein